MATGKSSSTTKKQQLFMDEPLREKSITEVPGVGDHSATRLKANGLVKVNVKKKV